MKSEHSGKRMNCMPTIPAGELERRGSGVQGPPKLSIKFKACLFEALSQNKQTDQQTKDERSLPGSRTLPITPKHLENSDCQLSQPTSEPNLQGGYQC